jgi:hypothetical protein
MTQEQPESLRRPPNEEEQASRAAGIPFVRVNGDNDEEAWREVARLIAAAAGEGGPS